MLDRTHFIFAGLGIVIGLGWLISVVLSFESAQGLIVDQEMFANIGGSGGLVTVVEFEYEGKNLVGEIVGSPPNVEENGAERRADVGDPLTVWFDGGDPTETLSFDRLGVWGGPALILGLSLFWFGYRLWSRRKPKQPGRRELPN